jgi:hypothetical protein
MPGPAEWRGGLVKKSLIARKILPRTLDARARAVLQIVQRAAKAHPEAMELPKEGTRYDLQDKQRNREFASESVVLLRNENKVLPLGEPPRANHQRQLWVLIVTLWHRPQKAQTRFNYRSQRQSSSDFWWGFGRFERSIRHYTFRRNHCRSTSRRQS